MLSDPVGTVWLNILFVIIIPMILYIGCCAPQDDRERHRIEKLD
jgi:hypothetical protein